MISLLYGQYCKGICLVVVSVPNKKPMLIRHRHGLDDVTPVTGLTTITTASENNQQLH